MTFLQRYHVNPRYLDVTLPRQVFDGLIDELDRQRIIFIDEDIEHLAFVRNDIARYLSEGDLAPLLPPVNVYLKRQLEET